MRRREFTALVGGIALSWPFAGRALMFLSTAAVLYPPGVRSQTPYSTPATTDIRYCAKPTKETEPPDCSFSNIKDCRASLKAKGGGRCYRQ